MANNSINAGLHIDWASIIMTIGLVILMAGGYWTLAYIPITNNIADIKQQVKDIHNELDAQRKEVVTRQDLQNSLNTTRVEFLSEVKRLDQKDEDMMKRREFDVWKAERDARLQSIITRQDRFTEALDAMYSRLMQQQPSYQQR